MPTWTKEQNLAINEAGKNIIVSAGAGSGKTAVLSERVLEHVKKGINIDDLLILTFTNAAAAEMKDRIRKKIAKIPELKDQLAKVDIAYITTFDAYALSLVKRYNHYLNISNQLTIIDASILTLKKRELLTSIFEMHYQKNDEEFLNLINDFCLKDDQEIFNAILSLNNKLDNSYSKEEILNNYLSNFYNSNNITNLIKEYLNIILKKINAINFQINNLTNYVDNSYIEKLQEVILPLLNSKTYEEIKLNSLIKLPVMRNADETGKLIKQEISDLLKEIVSLCKYNDLTEIENSLLSTKKYVNIIIKLINELSIKITNYKQENNAYEFIDISKLAIKILKENKYVREELKSKYQEILIDEYQDTNDLQDLFISQIENNNVYMVGDIKQSIYRFRNANPLLFKTKYDNYSHNNGGFKIDLNRNFRSRSEVLNNINMMFNLLMDNKIGGADYIDSHQMIFGLTPYNEVNQENYNMQILNYEIPDDKTYSNEEIEIFSIAHDIKDKIDNNYTVMDKETLTKRTITYGDFVILMDRSSSFERYKKIFEYLNIPLTIYRDKTISDSEDISIIKNIYNLIISINNKVFDKSFTYSYMSVARSYLFNTSDHEILKIIKDRSYSDTKIYEICYNLSTTLAITNNEELYNNIIDKFNFYNQIITTGSVDEHIITIDSIAKIVANTATFGYTPIQFYEYLKDIENNTLDIKLSLNKEASNSVKIMTIHASKGLEYHICYFSGLSKKFNIDDLKNKFYYDSTYGFITPYLKESPQNTILKYLLKNKYMEEEISEKLRLFYVALTRARESMILVTHLEKNELAYKDSGVIDDQTRLKYLCFNDMLSSIYDYLKPYINSINIEDLNLTKAYSFTKKTNYKDKIKTVPKLVVNNITIDNSIYEKDHFSKNVHNLITKEEKENLNIGLRMHYLLEITDFKNPNYTYMNDFEKKCISNFINDPIINNAISIYKEYEFIYQQDKKELHGIIDLLILKTDCAIIVDYKLKHTTDEAYLNQLNGYKKYIEVITNKKTLIYLYSIIDSKLIDLN